MAVVKMPVVGQRIDTYGELVNAVQLWADRDDDEFVQEIPVFIDFAQRELYRLLKIPPLEKEAYLEIKNGIAYIPSDFISGRYMRITGNPWLSIRETTFDEIRYKNGSDATATTESVEEILFSSTGPYFYFYPQNLNCPLPPVDESGAPAPTGSEMVMSYVCDPVPMTQEDDTCALLSLAPEALLYGALKHAAMFTKDNDAEQKFTDLESASVKQIAAQNKNTRLGFNGMIVPRSNLNTHW